MFPKRKAINEQRWCGPGVNSCDLYDCMVISKHVMQKFRVRKFQHFASIIFRISRIAGAGAGVEIDLKIRIPANSRPACPHFPHGKRPQFPQTLRTFLYFFQRLCEFIPSYTGHNTFFYVYRGPTQNSSCSQKSQQLSDCMLIK
jgi:hypothetical protein